ncbi:TPA: hypothetical protein ACGIK9_003332 [Acinetobacter baumannii]|uniref:hypothetical protein n=1 Tax=Acinetobacter baumannii TaxID=470 RepID=UPI00338EFDD3
MSSFDTLNIAHITHPNYTVPCTDFQTKDLNCNGSHFQIFNNQLYLSMVGFDTDDVLEGDLARPLDYTGEINAYGNYETYDAKYGVEYEFAFENGKLTSVELIKSILTEDKRDLYSQRPSAKSFKAAITIDYQDMDSQGAKYFAENTEECINNIRKVLNNDEIEIIYKEIPRDTQGNVLALSRSRWLHSVVQKLADFEVDKNYLDQVKKQLKMTDKHDNSFSIIIDETGYFPKA